MRLTIRAGERAGLALDVNGELAVGRAEGSGLVINDARVSGEHARFFAGPAGWSVTDLGSTNGTLVNGTRIPANQAIGLRPGDVITLGSHELVADVPAAPTAAAPGAAPFPASGAAAPPPPNAAFGRPSPPVAGPPAGGPPPGYAPPQQAGFPPAPGYAPPGAAAPAWGAPSGGFAAPGLLQVVVRTGPDAGRSTPLGEGGEVEIGRAANVALPLSDTRVSGRHAAIRRSHGRVLVRDLGSSNGTIVDGQSISGERELRPGSELQVGDTVLVLSDGSPLVDVGPTPTVLVSSSPRAEKAAKRSRRTGVLLGLVALLAAGGAAAFVALSGGDDEAFSPQRVAEQAGDGTVYILVGNTPAELVSSGSGAVIDAAEGLILTNNHVATGGNLWVTNETLGERTPARLIAAFPCDDVALIQVEASARGKLRALPIADPKTVTQGESVVALGYPGTAATARIPDAATRILTAGVVSEPDTVFDVPGLGSIPVIQHTATINPGNSGGPLLDGSGHLLGLNTFSFNDRSGRRLEGQNYAVAGKRILEILPELRAGRAQKWLGMQFGVPIQDGDELLGLEVTRIHPGSPISAVRLPEAFYRNGLPMVVAIDDKPVRTEEEYCDALPTTVGQNVQVTFAPLGVPGTTETVEVKLGRS